MENYQPFELGHRAQMIRFRIWHSRTTNMDGYDGQDELAASLLMDELLLAQEVG